MFLNPSEKRHGERVSTNGGRILVGDRGHPDHLHGEQGDHDDPEVPGHA